MYQETGLVLFCAYKCEYKDNHHCNGYSLETSFVHSNWQFDYKLILIYLKNYKQHVLIELFIEKETFYTINHLGLHCDCVMARYLDGIAS